ncbi:MAG TPA: phosphopantetheine-binding protein, partial [Acidimicrobiales bacterium]
MTTTDDQPTSASTSMTSTEEAIAAIWRDLLEIDEIETDDDFFDIGATSLTAVRLLSRVDDHFGKGALSPEQLYEDSRLSILAKAIDDNVGTD